MNATTRTTSFPKDRIDVLLLEGVHPAAEENFRRETFQVRAHARKAAGEELARLIGRAHVVGLRSGTRMDASALGVSPRLLAVGCFCIGTDQVDLDAAMELGVPVFNAPHSSTRSVAELVIGEVVMLMRRSFEKSQAVHAGQWPKSAEGCHEVRGRTIGIVGYGHIGSQVSVLAEAMGMHVLYHDIADVMPLGNAKRAEDLFDLLGRCDVVTLHVPGDETTRDLMDRAAIRRMRRGAYLLNLSRGSVVVIEALAEALRDGHLAGAAVDVFPLEPSAGEPVFQSPLQGLPNVILTPHVGGSTEEAQEAIARDVSLKLIRFLNNGSTTSAVNFPEVDLPVQGNHHRILHVHRNVPGVLTAVNGLVSSRGINVLGQYLRTNERIGYLVMDMDRQATREMAEGLRALPETIRVRVLH